MIDALGPDKAQVLPLVAFVEASLVHILVLRGDQGCDGQQIRCSLSRAQHYVADAADERLDNILNAVQLLLGTQTCRWSGGERRRNEKTALKLTTN